MKNPTPLYISTSSVTKKQLFHFSKAAMILMLGLLFTPSGSSATIFVDANVVGGANDGSTWENAFSDLQSALAASMSGDLVVVKEGTYYPGAARTDYFELKDGVELRGGSPAFLTGTTTSIWDPTLYPTILSGDIGIQGDSTDNSYHVLYSNAPTFATILQGFFIQDGNASMANTFNGSGGGMRIEGAAHLRIFLCIFQNNNAASNGGGLYFFGNSLTSAPRLAGCRFLNNTAFINGPAIDFQAFNGEMSPWVEDCVFEDNMGLPGVDGGAIRVNCINGASNAVFLNDTLTNNKIASDGGAVAFSAANSFLNCNFTGCVFTGNEAGKKGGAISFDVTNSGMGTPSINGCTFTDNIAGTSGGALENNANGGNFAGTINDCTFSGNFAGIAGAIHNDGKGGGSASPKVTACTFMANFCATFGGTIYNESDNGGTSSPIVTDCLFEGNYATDPDTGQGGAIMSVGLGGTASPEIRRCTFSNNHVPSSGGAIRNIGVNAGGISNPIISNNIFANNTADDNGMGADNDGYGGAIRNYGNMAGTCAPMIVNNTFYNNNARVSGETIRNFDFSSPIITNNIFRGDFTTGMINNDANASPTVEYNDVEGGYPGTGNIDLDPLFADPGNGDFSFSSASPCFNTGDNASVLLGTMTDHAGNNRIINNTVDMGALESTECTIPSTIIWEGAISEWGMPGEWDLNYVPRCNFVEIPTGEVMLSAGQAGWGNTLEVGLGAVLNVELGASLDIGNE